MILKRWLQEANETLVDLVIGCVVHSIFFFIIGLIFVPERFYFSLGILMGTVVSIGCAINMASGLENILSMDEYSARRTSITYSIIRMIVMLAVSFVGIKISQACFFGVIVGMFGLKTSAHLHVYTNVYITKKIRRKGR